MDWIIYWYLGVPLCDLDNSVPPWFFSMSGLISLHIWFFWNLATFISQYYQFLNLQKSWVTSVFKDYLVLRIDETRNKMLWIFKDLNYTRAVRTFWQWTSKAFCAESFKSHIFVHDLLKSTTCLTLGYIWPLFILCM